MEYVDDAKLHHEIDLCFLFSLAHVEYVEFHTHV